MMRFENMVYDRKRSNHLMRATAERKRQVRRQKEIPRALCKRGQKAEVWSETGREKKTAVKAFLGGMAAIPGSVEWRE